MSTETDALLAKAKCGDASAKSQLLDRHRDRLRRLVSARLDRRLKSRIDPSDVVQDALTDAAQKLSDYISERPVPFYLWLRRITWEQLVRLKEKHLKAARRTVLREACVFSEVTDQSTALSLHRFDHSKKLPDRRLLEAELKLRVLSALAKLSDSDRELLVLRYLEQISNSEIAAILNCSEGAVRTRHTRALTRLAGVMDRDTHE